MIIDSYNSQKIRVLSFWMIVLVVYIHSYYLEAEARTIPNFVQMLGSSITSVAVPLFYAISGFLFFNGITSVKQCFPKIKKRATTLLVPYLIWNVVFVLWYVVLAFIPGVSQYVNSDILSNVSIHHPIDTLFYLFVKPAGFQMWFLRDLILFVLLSPLLYVTIRRTKWLPFIVLLLSTGWMTRFWLTSFALGGTLAICYEDGLNIVHYKHKAVIAAIIFYLGYSVLSAFGFTSSGYEIVDKYISQLTSIVFMTAVWGGYDLFVKKDHKINKCLSYAMSYTFFIFLFHEPVFNIIKKIGLRILGVGDAQLIVLYLINPMIMVGISVCVGYILQRVTPKLYSISVGGR